MTEWISVKERLPKNDVPVIAYGKNEYGKDRRIRAKYIRQYIISDDSGDWEDGLEYCEETDEFYLPAGWYEENECEDTHWFVSFPITHWMPLPDPPEADHDHT